MCEILEERVLGIHLVLLGPALHGHVPGLSLSSVVLFP